MVDLDRDKPKKEKQFIKGKTIEKNFLAREAYQIGLLIIKKCQHLLSFLGSSRINNSTYLGSVILSINVAPIVCRAPLGFGELRWALPLRDFQIGKCFCSLSVSVKLYISLGKDEFCSFHFPPKFLHQTHISFNS